MDAIPEKFYYVPLPRLPRQRVAAVWQAARLYARKLPENVRPLQLRVRSAGRGVRASTRSAISLHTRSKAQEYGRMAVIPGSVLALAVVVGVAVARLAH